MEFLSTYILCVDITPEKNQNICSRVKTRLESLCKVSGSLNYDKANNLPVIVVRNFRLVVLITGFRLVVVTGFQVVVVMGFCVVVMGFRVAVAMGLILVVVMGF